MKYIIFLAVLLCACGSDGPSHIKSNKKQAQRPDKQINLTFLLDLSDRIDPGTSPDKPEHFERDIDMINYLTSYFLDQIRLNGLHRAKGKMRFLFHPYPPDPGIDLAVKNLNVDLSKMDVKEKKLIYKTLQKTVNDNISGIYASSIKQAKWPGSDVWRFFKNDVKEMAIDRDANYRNILVVFTDGYIYHKNSKDRLRNRYAYLGADLLNSYQLRNNPNWAAKMDQCDFGLICKRSDLQGLEVLMLEVTPSPEYKNDEDIIRNVVDKWFGEMKVKRWKVLNSDLPENTKQRVEGFLGE